KVLIELRPGRQAVRLGDFGIARLYHDARLAGSTLPSEMLKHTAFLAPEQVLDCRSAAPAADQYAAAAILYALLTGEPVYEQPEGVIAQLVQILAEEPLSIRERLPGLPPKLISAIHRALTRDPARRFPDVGAFRDALKPFAT